MKRELGRLQSTWRRMMLEMLWKNELGGPDRCYISLISQFTSSETRLNKRVFTLRGLWARPAQLSTSFSRPRNVKQESSFHERRMHYLYSGSASAPSLSRIIASSSGITSMIRNVDLPNRITIIRSSRREFSSVFLSSFSCTPLTYNPPFPIILYPSPSSPKVSHTNSTAHLHSRGDVGHTVRRDNFQLLQQP